MTVMTQERRRAIELGRYDVLDRPPRTDLVAVAEIAAQVAGTPMASISLIDDVSQHQVATAGFGGIVCAREEAMCEVVIKEDGPVIVEDATTDPRFAGSPFVTGVYNSVRFYAAHHLRTPAGTVIGVLCVLDTVPRTLDAGQQRALALLADRVVDLLELELRTRRLQRRTDELRAAVERLRDAQSELQRSNDQLAAFAGQVSHDLHNPLTAVSTSLTLLEMQMKDPEADPATLRFVVERATRASHRMQDMIDDLLAYAVLDGQLTVVPTDLGAVVADVREDLGTALDGVALRVRELPTLQGDAVQLRVLVQNLLSNAAKFRRSDRPSVVEVDAECRDDVWRVSVADNGLGIPPHAHEHVFNPFTRVHAGIAGNGIGLATVKRIVQHHGGRLGVEETPGGGATVWFELPAEPVEPARRP